MALLALSTLAHAQETALKPMLFPSPRPAAFKAPAKGDDALLRLLSSKDASVRKAAAVSLGRPDAIAALPALGTLMLNLNEPVENRVSAAMALGRVGNWRAAAYLKPGMSDSAKEVRFAAALALGKIKSDDSLPVLIRALSSDPEWWVRFGAAVALAENRDPKSVGALARSAKEETEWQVRMQAVRSLGQIGSREAAFALATPLRDSDASVRAAAAMAMGDIGGAESLSLLTDALKAERDEFPRQVITDTLKRLKSKA